MADRALALHSSKNYKAMMSGTSTSDFSRAINNVVPHRFVVKMSQKGSPHYVLAIRRRNQTTFRSFKGIRFTIRRRNM